MCYSQFGRIFLNKFRTSERLSDLQESTQWSKQALQLAECMKLPDITRKHSYLMGIGMNYRVKFDYTKSMQDLEMSDEALEQIFHESKMPLSRLIAGPPIVSSAVLQGLWMRAVQFLDEIILLVPDIILPSRHRVDSQHILRGLANISHLAATIYLKAGKSALEALEALESFRGIIANFQIDTNSEISILKECDPQLWNEYSQCRDEISLLNGAVTMAPHASGDIRGVTDYNAAVSRRQQLFQKLQHLQAKIRERDGFEKFLLPPRGKDIATLAEEGPLVCLNINDHGSDAFLVTPSGVEAVSLPQITEARMRSSAAIFNPKVYPQHRDVEIIESDDDNDDDSGRNTNDKVEKELEYWWYNLVKSVLKKLGLLRETASGESLPRIWWVGTGIMSLIPLHAVGSHGEDALENALSHVVSSHVPTLKIMQSLRSRRAISINPGSRKLVIVSMPSTPGNYGTLDTEEEANAITEHSKSVADVTTLIRPTKDAVIEALKTSLLAHFACHGSVDFWEPGKSALIVGKDTIERLSVDEILDTIMHSDAEIAYLSACSTAEIQSGDLIHESIHLATAFQLASFKSVIGTLWRADDQTAVAIAGKFYELLFREDKITGNSVAYALHKAVLQHIEVMPIKLGAKSMNWLPFIHFGC